MRVFIIAFIALLAIQSEASESNITLSCSFRHKSSDSLGQRWDENRKETLVINAQTGVVLSGGVAELLRHAKEFNPQASPNKFYAQSKGPMVEGKLILTLGYYDIDRNTGQYRAHAQLTQCVAEGLMCRTSTTEETGSCVKAERAF